MILPLLFSLVKIHFPFFANSFIQLHSQSLNSISTNPPLSHFRISAATTNFSTTSVCCQIHNLLFCISFLQLSRCDFLVMCSQFCRSKIGKSGSITVISSLVNSEISLFALTFFRVYRSVYKFDFLVMCSQFDRSKIGKSGSILLIRALVNSEKSFCAYKLFRWSELCTQGIFM